MTITMSRLNSPFLSVILFNVLLDYSKLVFYTTSVCVAHVIYLGVGLRALVLAVYCSNTVPHGSSVVYIRLLELQFCH